MNLAANLNNIPVGTTFVRGVVLCVLEQYSIHISAGVLKELVGSTEDDERYFAVAKDAQFIGFLHQAKLTLHKCHLNRLNVYVKFSRILKS